MNVLFIVFPTLFILATMLIVNKAVKKGMSRKHALIGQIGSVVIAMAVCFFVPFVSESASAADAPGEASQSERVNEARASAFGLGLMAAALVTGLSGIGGGIAVASAAPAAIAATSEDPKAFGKSLIFVALAEGIALYGLLISILIFNQIGKLGV